MGTAKEFWSVWNELEDAERAVNYCLNKRLSETDKDALFCADFASARSHFDALDEEGRVVTPQDRCIHSLCRPERLLAFVYGFTLFESGCKVVARYQQFFLVWYAIKRIKQIDNEGKRKGGIVLAHTRFWKIAHYGYAGARPKDYVVTPFSQALFSIRQLMAV